MSRNSYDVIVVGGGPAGASAAIACSSRGLRTLIVEANAHSGVRPGETLHPGMETLFRSLGVHARVNEANFLRHPGFRVQSRFKSVFETYGSDQRGPWMGYQADRATLHEILLDRASACGALILRGEKAMHPILRAGKVEGLQTNAGTYLSKFVVDAAGHRQWLLHELGVPSIRISPPLVAHYGWNKPREVLESEPGVPDFRMIGSTWEWSAPINSGRHAWVKLDLMDRRLDCRPGPPASLADCVPLGREGACDVTWKIATPCAGPGYFMVGDAAWVLDPASSHGVLKAVVSALVAGEAIVNSLNGSARAGRQQASYSAWMEGWFRSDAAALISIYSGMENPASWLSAAAELVRKISIKSSAQAVSMSRTNS